MKNVNLSNTRYDLQKVGHRIDELIKSHNLRASNICSTLPDGGQNPNKHLNISRQTLMKAIKGKAELSFNQILDICNFFHCSLSYLLCETEYSSKQKQLIGEMTGLSEKAIDMLAEWTKEDIKKNQWGSILSYIICHDRCPELFSHVLDLAFMNKIETKSLALNKGKLALEAIHEEVAQAWYISHIWTSIMEDLEKDIRTKE